MSLNLKLIATLIDSAFADERFDPPQSIYQLLNNLRLLAAKEFTKTPQDISIMQVNLIEDPELKTCAFTTKELYNALQDFSSLECAKTPKSHYYDLPPLEEEQTKLAYLKMIKTKLSETLFHTGRKVHYVLTGDFLETYTEEELTQELAGISWSFAGK